MREIILTQKADRDRLLAADYVPRDGVKNLYSALSNSLIKIVTGPRRAGKSVFAIQSLKEIDFAYLNFDDERLTSTTDYDEIIKGIRQVYGRIETVLFDEIQNLLRWELFVNRLQRAGYNIVITGSNSRLLSRELATHLTGRYVEFRLLPFSFGEFLAARGAENKQPETKGARGELLGLLAEWIQKGGYPEVVVNRVEHKGYLRTLFDGVLMKDVVKRYNVRNTRALRNLGFYLLTTHSASLPQAATTSFNELKRVLGFSSVATLEKYVSFLEEAFIVFEITRFSFKPREQMRSPRKFYAYDTGMADAVKFKISDDIGRFLENVVAIELKRRDEEFYYLRTSGDKEVDFVVKRGREVVELIQVCYDISDPKVEKRGLSALTRAAQGLHCNSLSVITWDDKRTLSKNGFDVRLIPIAEWLLGRGETSSN
jgi:predicted AAA+ superfamily ATPase